MDRLCKMRYGSLKTGNIIKTQKEGSIHSQSTQRGSTKKKTDLLQLLRGKNCTFKMTLLFDILHVYV